jgi:hypothetical protein
MVAVAIAALDFWVILPNLGSLAGETETYLLRGALPMANVLAVGMVIGQQRPGSSPFLLGFETFGAMALALYVVLASSFHREVVSPYLSPLVDPIRDTIGFHRPFILIPVLCSVGVLMLGWPQLAFALLGGFLFRRFKITITRR